MKRVESEILLKRKDMRKSHLLSSNYELILQQAGRVVEEIIEQWVKSDNIQELYLKNIIVSPYQFKTNSQLGYLYAEILPKFYKYMLEHGDTSSNEVKKNDIKHHPDINFVEIRANRLTGKIYTDPKSFAKASKEEMKDIIDKLLRLAGDFGILIETPEDYKKRKGIKEFVK